jgi:hypothetical protein
VNASIVPWSLFWVAGLASYAELRMKFSIPAVVFLSSLVVSGQSVIKEGAKTSSGNT